MKKNPIKPRDTEFLTVAPFPCFNYRVYILFTDSVEATADSLAEQGILQPNHDIDDTTHAFTVRMPNQSFTVLVYPYNVDICDLTHEAYHAVCCMFKWIGASQEEELFAYTLGYLCKLVDDDRQAMSKKLEKT